MSKTKKQLITVIGQRRSGLHAVVNWLIGLHSNRVRFINDPRDDLPLTPSACHLRYDYDVSREAIRLRPTPDLIKQRAVMLNWSVGVNLSWPWNGIARRILQRYWEPLLKNETVSLPTADGADDISPDTHIVLFENIAPARASEVLPEWLSSYRQQHGLPPTEREHLCIVARSPWNCLASTIKRPISVPPRLVKPEKVGALWVSYAKQLAGQINLFPSDQWEIHPLIYDQWIEQPEIRSTIAGKLGRSPNDLGISSTALHGGGSSFSNRSATPSKIDELTNRWRKFEQHPLMQDMLSSKEVARLAVQLGLSHPQT